VRLVLFALMGTGLGIGREASGSQPASETSISRFDTGMLLYQDDMDPGCGAIGKVMRSRSSLLTTSPIGRIPVQGIRTEAELQMAVATQDTSLPDREAS
jgi:hypothetical protein